MYGRVYAVARRGGVAVVGSALALMDARQEIVANAARLEGA